MTIGLPKVAIVHDWLTTMAGAERVVLALHDAFRAAPVYTSVYEPESVPLYDGLDVRTTWLQRLPGFLRRLHKLFPTLRVHAFRSLDLGHYDVIISSSSAEAKQVRKTTADQIHICYCHTPIRYYWSHYGDYRRDPGFSKLNQLVRLLMPLVIPRMRRLDFEAAQEIDAFVANSSEVQKRIQRYYRRHSMIVHPPVDVERFTAAARSRKDRHGYVIVGRQVPYKRIDLAVAACTRLNVPLSVYGDGPEHGQLKKNAGRSIRFVADANDAEIADAMGSAKAFLFPAQEDFGIVQVEALAAGAPVIAYRAGGALDVIQDGKNGLFFASQTVDSLAAAIEHFETMSFAPEAVQRTAQRFSRERFIDEMRKLVREVSGRSANERKPTQMTTGLNHPGQHRDVRRSGVYFCNLSTMHAKHARAATSL